MSSTLFFSVFILFTIIYTIIGIFAAKKVNTITDYFLAGRSLGFFPVMFTLIATQLGGGMLLGTAQEAYSIGLYGIFYTLGMTIGFLLLGSGIAAKLQSFNVATTAELFETRYNSVKLKKIAALLGIITMSGLLVGQVVGAKTLLSALGFFNQPLFIGFWLFVILYTMIGGLHAVVLTDMFQVLFIIILFGGIFVYNLIFNPQETLSIFGEQKYFKTTTFDGPALFATLLMPALFSLIEQDLAQRFFASRTKKIAMFAAFGAAFFIIAFSLVPIFLGMKAQLLGLSISPDQSPLIPVLQVLTNDFILALAICGIIAAITSTADSLLCAISSMVALTFNPKFLNLTHLSRSKVITLVIGLVALGASYIVPQNVIRILIESYEISVGCLLVPLLFCYFKPKVKKEAGIGGVVAGFIGLIVFNYWKFIVPKEILTLLLSLCGYYIGNFFNTIRDRK